MFDQLMKGMSPENKAEKTKEKETKKPEAEGFVECPLFSGEAKITVDEDSLLIAAALDQLPVLYGEITGFALINYRLTIQTVNGPIIISRMGQAGQWLYDHLYAAYNAAVLKSLLVEAAPQMEVRGTAEIRENNETITLNETVIRLYPDCVCILPADDHARRVPLCFVSGIEKDGFRLTLSLLTKERYTFAKLGYETDPFAGKLTADLQALRTKSVKQLQDTDESLGSMQAAAAAKLMPEGVSAPVGKLSAASPTLTAALENLITESRIADSYPVLKNLCGSELLFFGMKSPAEEKTDPAATVPGLFGGGVSEAEKEAASPKHLLWLTALGKAEAAVELAMPGDEAAATYLYHIQGSPETFAMILNRGMEATGFRRELFTLSDAELAKPGRTAEAMLIHRTPALQIMRKCFAGRVIHSGPEKWKKEMEKHLASAGEVQDRQTEAGQRARFCTNCGAKIEGIAKFCGECGTKL